MNCLIYDTCGAEKFKSINSSYYKNANAILLVYDITEQSSFEEVKNYYCQTIKELCKKDIPIILLGNKADLNKSREVKTKEGIQFALDQNYKFKETSCLKNENVADAFEALIEMWNFEESKSKRGQSDNNNNNKKKNLINLKQIKRLLRN